MQSRDDRLIELLNQYRQPLFGFIFTMVHRIADAEDVTVPDEDVEAEITQVRADDSSGEGITDYLDSDRGRSYVRSQLRRSQTVEMLADRWIEAHPEYSEVQHTHPAASSHDTATIEADAIEAAANIAESAGIAAEEAEAKGVAS